MWVAGVGQGATWRGQSTPKTADKRNFGVAQVFLRLGGSERPWFGPLHQYYYDGMSVTVSLK